MERGAQRGGNILGFFVPVYKSEHLFSTKIFVPMPFCRTKESIWSIWKEFALCFIGVHKPLNKKCFYNTKVKLKRAIPLVTFSLSFKWHHDQEILKEVLLIYPQVRRSPELVITRINHWMFLLLLDRHQRTKYNLLVQKKMPYHLLQYHCIWPSEIIITRWVMLRCLLLLNLVSLWLPSRPWQFTYNDLTECILKGSYVTD